MIELIKISHNAKTILLAELHYEIKFIWENFGHFSNVFNASYVLHFWVYYTK